MTYTIPNQDKLPLRISFFGHGCRVLVGKFNDIEWGLLNAESASLNLPLSEAVFDSSFYNNLSDIRINCLGDLGNEVNIHGLIDSGHSVIEFQRYRKRKRVYRFIEIMDSPTLFPLFGIDAKQYHINEEPRTIIAVEKEVGLVYGYKLNINDFSLEKVRFEVSELVTFAKDLSFQLITSVYYNDVELVSHNSNSLISRQYAVASEAFLILE